jgi:hypothetical protein
MAVEPNALIALDSGVVFPSFTLTYPFDPYQTPTIGVFYHVFSSEVQLTGQSIQFFDFTDLY